LEIEGGLASENLRLQNATSSEHAGRRHIPAVSTAHGALMAANILNSPRVVAVSDYVKRSRYGQSHGAISTGSVDGEATLARSLLARGKAGAGF
jgi:hypothetical protein